MLKHPCELRDKAWAKKIRKKYEEEVKPRILARGGKLLYEDEEVPF